MLNLYKWKTNEAFWSAGPERPCLYTWKISTRLSCTFIIIWSDTNSMLSPRICTSGSSGKKGAYTLQLQDRSVWLWVWAWMIVRGVIVWNLVYEKRACEFLQTLEAVPKLWIRRFWWLWRGCGAGGVRVRYEHASWPCSEWKSLCLPECRHRRFQA